MGRSGVDAKAGGVAPGSVAAVVALGERRRHRHDVRALRHERDERKGERVGRPEVAVGGGDDGDVEPGRVLEMKRHAGSGRTAAAVGVQRAGDRIRRGIAALAMTLHAVVAGTVMTIVSRRDRIGARRRLDIGEEVRRIAALFVQHAAACSGEPEPGEEPAQAHDSSG